MKKTIYMGYETLADEGILDGVITEHWVGKTSTIKEGMLSYTYSVSDTKAQVFKPLHFKKYDFTPHKLYRVTLPKDMYDAI